VIERVWCLSPDRLARVYAYQVIVLDELARHGVGVRFTDAPPLDDELLDIFGEEMTTATGTCAGCGATRPLGELAVYRQAPELSLGVAAARTCCW
jgi:hypothetical protein